MNKIKYMACLMVAFTLFACAPEVKTFDDIVNTAEGKVKGTRNKDNGIAVFKGIPYAAPPVGDLRWKAPQAHDAWEGELNCTNFGPAAMQADPQPFYMWTEEFIAPARRMSEDCLYLNIWTKATSQVEKLPVIVYIHGGAFTSGSGAVPVYDGEAMAKKGIVFVTINYRLGIFGFLAHPELTAESPHHASGNYGLLDQVAALRWIRKNITAFGGNPDNVTIAGQSAGAFSVNFLVASPLAKGLFHRAIAESGGAVLPTDTWARTNTLEQAEKSGAEFTAHLNAASIKELRAMPSKDLIKEQYASGAIIDGYFLPEPMQEIFAQGKQNDVPVLLGWNEDEGLFGGPFFDARTFKSKVQDKYGDRTREFLEVFPATTDEEAKRSQVKLGVQTTFGLQGFAWMVLQNETGNQPVYQYLFTQKVPYGSGQEDFGAFHSGEIAYAYGNLDKSAVRPWTEADYQLEKTMSAYWAQFARTGNPNFKGAPEWYPCKAPEYQTMILKEDPHQLTLPDLEQLDFLFDFYSEKLAQPKK
ncbi:MAG: carboxylesterase family protein [Bacteroidales bacterium]|nr:carboxylesterase family protein [Bacteroidales bacterium]